MLLPFPTEGCWQTATVPVSDLAAKHGLHSVAFCCISTGEFRFPNELAAQVAIQTVIQWQRENPNQIEVIFNVFKERDYDIYEKAAQSR